ncbi:histidine phosphatase family protein [Sporobolomyces salmoneus]|uniref:histidine phosphatase family protein n=1 Tax=Sporobolomyces salmoneus TaxID=183962 RepID=UPI0031820B6A
MAPVIVTLVRHGESVDNLTSLWAGHRDAPLTNYGYTQAQRLGDHFKDVPITAIYTSDLKRAQTTARCVYEKNETTPKPPFTVSPLLREQFFGEAEGMPWDAGKYHSAHLPWEDHRAFRLAPNAESLNDVSRRATQVLRHFILPHLLATASVPSSSASFGDQHHLVLFAHGIWLSEMLFAIKLASDPSVRFVKSSGGYQNTAWSRIEIELDGPGEGSLPRFSPTPEGGDGVESVEEDEKRGQTEFDSPPAPSEAAATPGQDEADEEEDKGGRPPLPPQFASLLPTLPPIPTRDPSLPPVPNLSTSDPIPRVRYRVVAFNQSQHLVGLKRTKGGVGSGSWDDKQRGLKEFFAGGGGGGAANPMKG